MAPINADKPRAVKTLMCAWCIDLVIRTLVTDPRVTAIAAALMAVDRVRLWQDQVIVKPGQRGAEADPEGNVGFHQDYSYWQDSTTTNMITANIVLQDADAAHGAMRVFSGPRRHGLLRAASASIRTSIACDGAIQPRRGQRRRVAAAARSSSKSQRVR